MALMKLAKWASVMVSMPSVSAEVVVWPVRNCVDLLALPVVDVVAVAIDDDGALGAHDDRAAVAVVELHALAAAAFPGDESCPG